MISERVSCAIRGHFSNLRLHYYYLLQEEYVVSQFKTTPVKTFLNCITTKSTGTMQPLYSALISTHNLPALWGQKNNFGGMLSMLINCSGFVNKDNITKTNYTLQYFSHTIHVCLSVGVSGGKKEEREPAGH